MCTRENCVQSPVPEQDLRIADSLWRGCGPEERCCGTSPRMGHRSWLFGTFLYEDGLMSARNCCGVTLQSAPFFLSVPTRR
ncbi:hypothetical protein [Microbulbifer halophilus]|uniref:hypothetical protein n=1 Tax=Microbulbifer halophilus TaxID=453963 RepID=UPI00361A7B6B